MSSWPTTAFQRSAEVTRGWTWSVQCLFSSQAATKQKAVHMKAKSSLEITHLWKSQRDPVKQNFMSKEISTSSEVKFKTCSYPESILLSLMTYFFLYDSHSGGNRELSPGEEGIVHTELHNLFLIPGAYCMEDSHS